MAAQSERSLQFTAASDGTVRRDPRHLTFLFDKSAEAALDVNGSPTDSFGYMI